MARGGREFTHPGIGENRRRNAGAGGDGGGAIHLPLLDHAGRGAGAEAAGYLSHGDDGDADATGGLDRLGRGEERTPAPAATQNRVVWTLVRPRGSAPAARFAPERFVHRRSCLCFCPFR